ncbi:hypothetical protein Tco_1215493 [Tanacetum coccineum]
MDPNSSLGKFCLGENIIVISSDKVEGSGDWNSPEFQDTLQWTKEGNELKGLVFTRWIPKKLAIDSWLLVLSMGWKLMMLDFNLDDVALLVEEELPPFVCKIGKSSRNMKRAMENLNFVYQDRRTSSSADKVELDGKIVKEEEEAVKRIKGEALKEKDDPEAFIFSIKLEG